MPLFRASSEHGAEKPGWRRLKNRKRFGGRGRMEEDGSVRSLTRLCLFSLADNMKEVWVKDYADKYLDKFSFRHIMGPFNPLPGDLVEELTLLLCSRKLLSRAALHLLLVPQLRNLTLGKCPGLVSSALCAHIAARCQGLLNLDLSGAQQLPPKVLSETLQCLPALRSLSLTGTLCDRSVIRTLAQHCHSLRYLDVSRCHFLSPAALLSLVQGDFCSSSPRPSCSSVCSTSSISASLSPPPLTHLLALDIGFGEQDGDPVVAAAYLVLALPTLKVVALEGLAQACRLIEHREFSQTEEFTDRERVPRLVEVWRERRSRENVMEKRGGHEEEGCGEDSDEDVNGDEDSSCSANRGILSDQLILRLKDVKGVTCDSLSSLNNLCPDICSISVNAAQPEEDSGRQQGLALSAGLQTWSGQLQNLLLLFPKQLIYLLPALHVAGSSLLSLTLEGVKTRPSGHLLEAMRACPRLRELHIFAEPPQIPHVEVSDEQHIQDHPKLQNLCSLTLSFSHSPTQKIPDMCWNSLKSLLRNLLGGSPLLERVSLVSLPCSLNSVLISMLCPMPHNVHFPFAGLADVSSQPLKGLQHADLTRTDVQMNMVEILLQRNRKLKFVDVSHCWEITTAQVISCKIANDVRLVWV